MAMAYPGSMLVHQLRYHRWASQTLLRAVEALPEDVLMLDRQTSFKTIPQTLLHICQADEVWFSRLNGISLDMTKLGGDFDLAALGPRWSELLDRFVAWGEALPAEKWESDIRYIHRTGKEYSTLAWQIVLHAVNHGTAHRGQVASMLRQSGITPPKLDLIEYYRTAA